MDQELHEVVTGLRRTPPTLSPRWFYDARGSELFEQITTLEAYYPTRSEKWVLANCGEEIAGLLPKKPAVVELGSGTGEKVNLLLEHLPHVVRYVPVDISPTALARTQEQVQALRPELLVEPVVADFTDGLVYAALNEPRVVFYPGSTIGNFDPAEAADFLANLVGHLRPEDRIVLGVDRVKSSDVLTRAYDDPQGVTAAFNRNLLVHLNRRFGADFVLDQFQHRAVWNAAASRIEMHLVSLHDQVVQIGDLRLELAQGAYLHTENSYKYDEEALELLAARSRVTIVQMWSDPNDWFSVAVLAPAA